LITAEETDAGSTYNQNYYLSRYLWYHAHFPFGEINVADSSPEKKMEVKRETVAKVWEMFGANILYQEYEPKTEKYEWIFIGSGEMR